MDSETDRTEQTTFHQVSLNPTLSNSALGKLLQRHFSSPELKRMNFYSKFFSEIHLKNTVTTKVQNRLVEINGKQVINYGSANYLGLDQHPEVIDAAIRGIRTLGNHSGCSRMFSSHYNIILLEKEISELVGAESVLVGANVSQVHEGTIPALFSSPDCTLFIDRFAHTSMHQAALIAKAKGAHIERVNVSSLEETSKKIIACSSPHKVILVDGLYSMQGDLPDLLGLETLCKRQRCILYVDDAHGLGIYGSKGGGVAEAFQLSFENLVLVGSLQKGLGAFGAFVAGEKSLVDLLRVTSRSHIFSGTLQPAAVEGARKAIEISRSDEGKNLRNQLQESSQYLRRRLQEMGYIVPSGSSPIIPVTIGEDAMTLMSGRKMFDMGIYINSVLYPAVPRNQGILRISLTTGHSRENNEALLNAFERLKEDLDKNSGSFRSKVYVLKEVLLSKLKSST